MTILYLFLDINNKNAYTAKISLFFRLVGVWTQEIYENSSKMNRNQQRFGKIYHFQSFYHLSDSENQSLIPNFCYINLISISLSITVRKFSNFLPLRFYVKSIFQECGVSKSVILTVSAPISVFCEFLHFVRAETYQKSNSLLDCQNGRFLDSRFAKIDFT